MDNTKVICSRLWTWYIKSRDAKKDNQTWDRLLETGKYIVRQYDGIDRGFAEDMFLLFVDRLEELELRKQEEGENYERNT